MIRIMIFRITIFKIMIIRIIVRIMTIAILIIPLLLNLFLPPLALVEVCKVVADDGDGQGNHEHPADGAHGTNNLICCLFKIWRLRYRGNVGNGDFD